MKKHLELPSKAVKKQKLCIGTILRKIVSVAMALTIMLNLSYGAFDIEAGAEEYADAPASEEFAVVENRKGADYTYEDFEYTVFDDGSVTVNNYIGSETHIVIPTEYMGKKINAIKWQGFNNCDTLVSVTIPEGITSIYYGAFSDCDNLSEIKIADSVSEIGYWTFKNTAYYNNENNWIDGVLYLENWLIDVEQIYEPLQVKNGTRGIADLNMIGWVYLYEFTEVYIPASVKYISDNPFGYSKCEKIIVDSENTEFASKDGILFSKDLKTLRIFPAGKNIDNYAIPNSTTSIGDYAFLECSNLKSITIPDSVTEIGSCAFDGCEGLTSLAIPSRVKEIKQLTFAGCSRLRKIFIPNAVVNIGGLLFGYSTYGNLVDIYYSGAEKDWNNISIDEYENDDFLNATVHYNCYRYEDFLCFELEDKTIEIGAYVGSDTKLTIPSEIEGKSVTSIGNYIFEHYYNLTSISIPDSINSIGDFAFWNCGNLTNITILDSVSNIGVGAFGRCLNLVNINVESNNKEYTSVDGILFTKDKKAIIAYPCGKTETSYTIPNGVTNIYSYAFWACDNLTSITIPNGVTSINYCAFSYCDSLTSITIPNSVTSIGNNAFYWCDGLTSLIIGNSITKIGESAFWGCDSLVDIYYRGGEEEWNSITIGRYNEDLLNATIHYDYKTQEEINIENFVERLYTKLLGRISDAKGKANHVNSLLNGKTAAQVGASFVNSAELKNKKLSNNEFVKRMYQTFLNRTPSSSEITRWAKTLDNGCTYEYVLMRFVASAEFKKLASSYGITAGTYTPSQNRDKNENVTAFVSRMYTKALKRTYDVTGLNNHTGRILNKTHTPAQIAKLFFFSTELKNKNLSDEEFVTRLYNALFDRNPDAKGKANWLTKMKNGYTREKVFDGFAASAEFKNLVASFGL